MTPAITLLQNWRARGLLPSCARHVWLASIVALAVVLAGADAASAAILKRVGPADVEAESIVAGADGNLWLGGEDVITRMTPAGVVTTYDAGSAASTGLQLAAGPDGNVWFTDFGANLVGRITPLGMVTKFSAGIPPRSGPLDIAAGPDGNMWFTEPTIGRVARVTPLGLITQFSAGISPRSGLSGITGGPDGNVWFGVLGDRARIARVTPSGTITQFATGLHRSAEIESTAGPDGNVWFTEGNTRVGRITPTGKITEFSAGISPGAVTTGITAGFDGNLWFTEFEGGRLGRITPTGNITEFSAGLAAGELLSAITSGPFGSLYFSKLGGIARLTPTPGTPVSVLTRRARVNARGATTIKLACGAGSEPCAGRLDLTLTVIRGTRILGSARLALSPGEHATVKLKLNASGRRTLAKARGRRLNARYRASSSGGDAKGRLTLTAPRGIGRSTS